MGERRGWWQPEGMQAIVALALLPALGAAGACSMLLVRQMEIASLDLPRQDLATIATALERYRQRHGEYPAAPAGLAALVEDGLLERAPLDPWGHPYSSALQAGPTDGGERTVLGRDGRDGIPGTSDDLGGR